MTSPARANGAAHTWKVIVKTGVVLAGYAAVFAVASAVIYVRQLHTQGLDAQASNGMYAIGQDILFVQAFGGLALFPTGLALYFLRRIRVLWTILVTAALALAATGPVTAAVIALSSSLPNPPSFLTTWAIFGVLRMLAAPVIAPAFLLCACLVPTRFLRWALLGVTVTEGAVVAYGFFHWFIAPRLASL